MFPTLVTAGETGTPRAAWARPVFRHAYPTLRNRAAPGGHHLEHLNEKGLIIFAGKGGVGKTTCSAALALQFAAQGRKTLLVTVDPAMRLEDSLGVPLDSRETLVVENLWASMLDPEEIIRDKLKDYAEGERVMDHPLFRYVSNYLPGLNELMAIGKLNELRHDAEYDTVVVDTAPTGHALSFLSAPRAIQEIMSEKSLLRWAMRGYTFWLKVNKASRGISRFFGSRPDEAPRSSSHSEAARKSRGDTGPTAPDEAEGEEDEDDDQKEWRSTEDIDIEAVFQKLAREAEEIQAMLTDSERTALNIVTLPEKLPVEETVDLYDRAVKDLGITLGIIVVNKVQPDTLGPLHERFAGFLQDNDTQRQLAKTLEELGHPGALLEAMCQATQFSDRRLKMNLAHIDELTRRLPEAQQVLIPLFKEDIAGLDALNRFRAAMYRSTAETVPGVP